MSDEIFMKSKDKIKFVGNFENFYNKKNDWNQDLERNHLLEEYNYSRNKILDNLKNFSLNSIADIGCGYGMFTNQLKVSFPNIKVSGYDISKTSINIAKNRYEKNLNFYNHDIISHPLKQKYDLLLLNQVIYYLIHKESRSLTNIINSTNRYIYMSIFMNDNHKYGELHFRKKDLFIKYLTKEYNLSVVLSDNKKINDNECFGVIFDVNKK